MRRLMPPFKAAGDVNYNSETLHKTGLALQGDTVKMKNFRNAALTATMIGLIPAAGYGNNS
jgi:hypothetical protein